MLRVVATAASGTWASPSADTVVLDYDARHRRRTTLTSAAGVAYFLDLPTAVALRGGDALVLEDGRHVAIVAAAEPLFELRVGSPFALARIAWHLGNRHIPVELGEGWLRIRHDHVLAELAQRMGAEVVAVSAGFDPEPGAYATHAHALVRGT